MYVHTMSMSRCSSTVLTVRGRVGLVEEGITLGWEHTVMISGAWPPGWMKREKQSRVEISHDAVTGTADRYCTETCQMSTPPAPSVWYVCMVRPLNAARVPSTQQDSFKVSV